ncbi:DEAD/DEAH box helicase [Acetobacter nitrogenifigens]|nr:DEAD/DEAH box helicase [Acetobacter nitrogenifigens]
MPSQTSTSPTNAPSPGKSGMGALGLAPRLTAMAHQAGLDAPTPIQSRAIPVILEGADAEIIAPTGAGKTACYLLPLMHILLAKRAARALVVVPTRELARQIAAMGRQLAPAPELRPLAVYGGAHEEAETPESAQDDIPERARIIVGTPGRLLDLTRRDQIDLASCRHVVLDEGDRLMSPEFRDEMHDLLPLLAPQRQTVLVSATLPPAAREASRRFLYKPQAIAPETGKTSIRQAIMFVEAAQKPLAAEAVLRRHPDRNAIVFVASRDEAGALAKQLRKRGLKPAILHGGLTQPDRNRAMQEFASGRAAVLVATDLAARGLDIEQVGQVINMTPPEQPETYVHRIGRTGRAGRVGWAITLCAMNERSAMRKIETALSIKLTVLPTEISTPEKAAPHIEPSAAPTRKRGRSENGRNKSSKTA